MAKSAKQEIVDKAFTMDLGNIKKAKQRNQSTTNDLKGKDFEEKVEIVLPSVPATPKKRTKRTNTKVPEVPGSSKLFNWEVHRTLKNRFNTLALDLLRGMGDFKYHKRDFFRLCVAFHIEKLEAEGNYRTAGEEFIRYIQRRGKRPVSDRYPKGDDKEKLVIELDTETYQGYLNIIYSHAVLDGDTMNENLSTKFFLYDFVDIIENDLAAIIERFKSI